jgi:hypothetical protein
VGEPEAVIVKLKGVPIVPAGVSGLLVMIGATPAGATVISKAASPVPTALLALIRTGVVPAVVGMPAMTPVVVLRMSPAGSWLDV